MFCKGFGATLTGPLVLFFYSVRSPFLKKLEDPDLVCKVIKVQT